MGKRTVNSYHLSHMVKFNIENLFHMINYNIILLIFQKHTLSNATFSLYVIVKSSSTGIHWQRSNTVAITNMASNGVKPPNTFGRCILEEFECFEKALQRQIACSVCQMTLYLKPDMPEFKTCKSGSLKWALFFTQYLDSCI